jgi:zinc transport system ATP-binding protein
MDSIISVDKLTFRYGNNIILDKVSFSINKGDFVGIIGVNGAGKSTLFKLILGELLPLAGNIHIFDREITKFKDWSKIGYVPQTNLLTDTNFPANAEEIVRANLFSKIGFMRFPKRKHFEAVNNALKLVDMQDYAKRLIGNMSGGQQQRVMIAKALVNKPEVIFLDEPATGIDEKSVKSLYELLKKLNTELKITIVMITHDKERTLKYANRILLIEEGSLKDLHLCGGNTNGDI